MRVGLGAAEDHAAAVAQLTGSDHWSSFIDSDRVGTWGWSGGGTSTLWAMFAHPTVYSVGASVAFVADQRLYDSIWQERFSECRLHGRLHRFLPCNLPCA